METTWRYLGGKFDLFSEGKLKLYRSYQVSIERFPFISLWHHEGRCLAHWSNSSRKLLSGVLLLLHTLLKPVLSSRCTHVKGRGGIKSTVKELKKRIGAYRFVARFDIASYYDSMCHHILLDLLSWRKPGGI